MGRLQVRTRNPLGCVGKISQTKMLGWMGNKGPLSILKVSNGETSLEINHYGEPLDFGNKEEIHRPYANSGLA